MSPCQTRQHLRVSVLHRTQGIRPNLAFTSAPRIVLLYSLRLHSQKTKATHESFFLLLANACPKSLSPMQWPSPTLQTLWAEQHKEKLPKQTFNSKINTVIDTPTRHFSRNDTKTFDTRWRYEDFDYNLGCSAYNSTSFFCHILHIGRST